MDQRGECCIARYAGGAAYDMAKVDRIMQRFRPIAPKPASGNGSVSGSSSAPESGRLAVKAGGGRGKRRRACKDSDNSSTIVNKMSNSNNNTRRRKSSSKEKDDSGGDKAVRTLPLLPEMPEVKEDQKITAKQDRRTPRWLSFGNGEIEGPAAARSRFEGPAAAVARRVVLWSCVKVERVTDTRAVGCVDVSSYGNCLGRTDEERVRSLEADTCPGFISDGLNRVRWMNEEYRRMVSVEGAGTDTEEEVVTWVVMEEGVALPQAGCVAFTCRVKVVTWEKQKSCKTVPCDVWRMDCGGFAWRLDIRAALSLAL